MRQERAKCPGKKLVILPGKMYTFLRVLREVFTERDSKGNPVRAFDCQCNCKKGTIDTYLLGNLESGNSKSCGCLRGEPGSKSKVSIGDRFGPIRITRELEERTFACGQSKRQFEGKCECGDIRPYLLGNLKKLKKRKSCIHQRKAPNKGIKTGKPSWNRKEIPVGELFWELTVEGEEPKVNGRTRVRCKCSCGEKAVVDLAKLRNGHTKSCGHLLNRPSVNRKWTIPGEKFGQHTVINEFAQKGEWWVNVYCDHNVPYTMTVRNLRKKGKRNSDCACVAKKVGEWHHLRKPFTNMLNRALRNVLKEGGLSKVVGKAFKLFPYTKQAAFEHLHPFLGEECQECKSVILTLSNSQIDHIKPLCKAKTEAEVIALYRLVNLRMICKDCNHKKGGKFNESKAA